MHEMAINTRSMWSPLPIPRSSPRSQSATSTFLDRSAWSTRSSGLSCWCKQYRSCDNAGRNVGLVFAGPASEHDRQEIVTEAVRHGVEHEIEITGHLDDARYANVMSRVSLAVQLRAQTNGESSAAMHDCIASGVPLVVTSIGAARELPEFVEKVSVEVTAEELASRVGELLDDRSRREHMAEAGLSYAKAHDFAQAAALTLAVADLTQAG